MRRVAILFGFLLGCGSDEEYRQQCRTICEATQAAYVTHNYSFDDLACSCSCARDGNLYQYHTRRFIPSERF